MIENATNTNDKAVYTHILQKKRLKNQTLNSDEFTCTALNTRATWHNRKDFALQDWQAEDHLMSILTGSDIFSPAKKDLKIIQAPVHVRHETLEA